MKKVSRRTLLKWGAAGTAFVAMQGGLPAALYAGEAIKSGSISRTTGRRREATPSTCLQCSAGCGIVTYTEDGRLVKIEGNPKHPNNRGRLCSKGQAGLNQLYDPERILYPLRRKGARGEGRWQRISWEEALDEVTTYLQAVQNSGHPERFIFQAGAVPIQGIITRFLNAFGTPTILSGIPRGGSNKRVAHELTWGGELDVNDVANTKYILNFGSNPYEAHVLHLPLVQRIVDARVNGGAKLVTFDVRLSNTAGKSDEWFPLNPGTDGLIALTMANVIIQKGLHDRDFLDNWTNYSSAKLADYLSQYTPEMAQRVSGVRAEDIERIAEEFASTSPATTISGAGLSMHANGSYNERCVSLLNAVTGNIDAKGGYCLPRKYDFEDIDPKPPQALPTGELARPLDFPFSSGGLVETAMPILQKGLQQVSVYMTYMHNPAYSDPDHALTNQVLRDEKLIPYFVAVDAYMSESAALADLILPDAIYLERWELDSAPSFEMVPFVSLRQPVVKPMGEAKAFQDVCIQLAKRLGGGMEQYFQFNSTEEYLKSVVSKIDKLSKAGGLDYLKQNGVWYDPEARPSYKSYETAGFGTPSGKFEIYSERLERLGFDPLPVFKTTSLHDNAGEGKLILTTFKWNVHTTSRTANCKWLSEIRHDNPVWINPETAKSKGIEEGDLVMLQSPSGSITATAHITHGVHPQVVAISGSCGHWEYGNMAKALKAKTNHPDTQLVWWEKRGNGVHPNAVIPVIADPIGREQAWMGTVVSLAKA